MHENLSTAGLPAENVQPHKITSLATVLLSVNRLCRGKKYD